MLGSEFGENQPVFHSFNGKPLTSNFAAGTILNTRTISRVPTDVTVLLEWSPVIMEHRQRTCKRAKEGYAVGAKFCTTTVSHSTVVV
jgi:hypothetical protein